MAYGVDIWAAEIVVRLKERDPKLHLVAIIPYPGFDEGWEEDWRQRYHRLLSLAEYVCADRYDVHGRFSETVRGNLFS